MLWCVRPYMGAVSICDKLCGWPHGLRRTSGAPWCIPWCVRPHRVRLVYATSCAAGRMVSAEQVVRCGAFHGACVRIGCG